MTTLTGSSLRSVNSEFPSWRRKACFWLPAVVLAVLVFDDVGGNVIVRALTAGIIGTLFQVFGTLAYGFIQIGVAHLLGEKVDYRTFYEPTRSYISGLLIAVAVWAWWQHDRDRVVKEVASCVSHEAYKARTLGLHGLVMQCYQATLDTDNHAED